MKYVIWGAGQLGRKALSVLDKYNVIAFIDSNKELQGSSIDGVMIYAPEYLDNLCQKYIILITPDEFEEQIANQLESSGKNNYLMFSDHPYCINLSESADSVGFLSNLPNIGINIVLYGITWFNIYLYDILKQQGKKPIIYSAGRNHEIISGIIEDQYLIERRIECFKQSDCVLAPLGVNADIPNNKFIEFENFIEKAYPTTNPMIKEFYKKHKGKRCFIIATGPSLTIDDLNRLKNNNEICISMNRIYNVFDRTSWRPDYYVVEDIKMIEDLAEEIANLKVKYKFVNAEPQCYWSLSNAKSSIGFTMIMQNCLNDKIRFSTNPDKLLYNGYTVTYICLQLAVYMGFSEIYLVGVDFNYSDDIYAETNHFEGYQRHYKDIRLNPVKPDRMRRAYEKARKVAEANGVHIYNATRGGKLDVFDRVYLDDIL